MKNGLRLWLLLSVSVISSFTVYAQAIPNDSLYLGQTPPGTTPKIFNLSVTTGLRAVERIAITSDGKEIYYTELDTYEPTQERIKCYIYKDDKWQGPTVAFEGYMGARLSVNDSIMYMQKNVNAIPCVFYSKRVDTGWSTPVRLLSTNQQQHYFQMTKLNNFYLSSNLSGGVSNRDICKLITVNSDTLIQSLGIPINGSMDENDFFIAADESYIVFSRSNSSTAGDIFISYKKDNGKWTNPKSLGAPINTPSPNWEYGQFVTKDNKYLFFTRGGNYMSSYYVYWVKIDNLIDSLKHTNFIPYLNNQISDQSFTVGHLSNYAIPDSVFIDDDGNNTLTYSATLSDGKPLPAWLLFDPATRTFSGTPSEAGNINIKVTARDISNANVSCTFTINVTVSTGIEKANEHIPKSMNLYQNYPNPFNPTTTIKFAIPKDGRYKLGLFNLLGELVQIIFDKEYEAGYFSETFNAAALPSGMYIYRLTGNKANVAHKMILLR